MFLSGFSQVKSGLTSVDLGHSSMSQTYENMDSVRKLIPKSKIMTICAVTDMLGISFGWVQRILRDNLNMH
jgi:ribosomal protein S25